MVEDPADNRAIQVRFLGRRPRIMTIKELKELLNECTLDENSQVILSSDGEGNHFSPACVYTWSGVSWTGDDIHFVEEGETPENPCLIIYPT